MPWSLYFLLSNALIVRRAEKTLFLFTSCLLTEGNATDIDSVDVCLHVKVGDSVGKVEFGSFVSFFIFTYLYQHNLQVTGMLWLWSGVKTHEFSRSFRCSLYYTFKSDGLHVILSVSVAFYRSVWSKYCVLQKADFLIAINKYMFSFRAWPWVGT